MKSIALVLAVMAATFVIQLNANRQAEGKSAAVANWRVPSQPRAWIGTPVQAPSPTPSTPQRKLTVPEPPISAVYASQWFGQDTTRTRVIGLDPKHGFILLTLKLERSEKPTGEFPTFREVQRLYTSDGQDQATIGRSEYVFRDGHIHVSEDVEFPFDNEESWYIDPSRIETGPLREFPEAYAWEGIRKLRVEPDGSLTVAAFDETFKDTIAKRYVLLGDKANLVKR